MTALRLIAGLGNPGPEYEDTRHNAGFWLLDRLALELGGQWRVESKFQGQLCRVKLAGQDLWLLKPTTFMNHSGRSVSALMRFHQIKADEMLVVHDELDLPPGVARLKKGGGSGGHNGLKDISAAAGTPDYWRLRLGIGHPGDRHQVTDYVLRRPGREEQALEHEALDRALLVMPQLVAGEFERAQMALHTDKEKP
jgi:PTH1 family peptidyl-tRNA hydrolase